jgi:hypothetical protein
MRSLDERPLLRLISDSRHLCDQPTTLLHTEQRDCIFPRFATFGVSLANQIEVRLFSRLREFPLPPSMTILPLGVYKMPHPRRPSPLSLPNFPTFIHTTATQLSQQAHTHQSKHVRVSWCIAIVTRDKLTRLAPLPCPLPVTLPPALATRPTERPAGEPLPSSCPFISS